MGMISKSFWQGKQVFVTGHTGFKGAWLSLWLHAMGAKVTGYALAPNTEPSLFSLLELDSKVHSIIANVQDGDVLKKAVCDAQPDIILHLAAQPLVRYSYANPVETYATNVMGTVHMLEAFRACGSAKVMINVTTDKCYDNQEREAGYRENEPMGGYDPYSNSKGCSELITSAYRNSFVNPADLDKHDKALASGRAGNVIGGGDWSEDRLVPDMVRAVLAGESVKIRYPDAIRPWQHVLEPLSGYLLLTQKNWEDKQSFASGWNFGPEDQDCQNVGTVVNEFVSAWGEGAAWEHDGGEHLHEAHFLKLDITKAKTQLHWTPKWSLSEAVNMTVDWYRAWTEKQNMADFTLHQINQYTETQS
jgi:CDP-glucose 4,6-dehydratase